MLCLTGCARPDEVTPTALAGATPTTAHARSSAKQSASGATTPTTTSESVTATTAAQSAAPTTPRSGVTTAATSATGPTVAPTTAAPVTTPPTVAPAPPASAPPPAPDTPTVDLASVVCTPVDGTTTHWSVDVHVNAAVEHVEHDQARNTTYNGAFGTGGVDYTLIVDIDANGACTSFDARPDV
jgi:hypothetical protein